MSGTSLGFGGTCVISVNVHGITNGKKENLVTVESDQGTGNTSDSALQVGSLIGGLAA